MTASGLAQWGPPATADFLGVKPGRESLRDQDSDGPPLHHGARIQLRRTSLAEDDLPAHVGAREGRVGAVADLDHVRRRRHALEVDLADLFDMAEDVRQLFAHALDLGLGELEAQNRWSWNSYSDEYQTRHGPQLAASGGLMLGFVPAADGSDARFAFTHGDKLEEEGYFSATVVAPV